MTRNGPPLTRRSGRPVRGLEPQLQGLHRREVAQPQVGGGARQPALDRVLGRRAGAVGDGEERGQRREADQLGFGELDAVLGGDVADACPRPATAA